MKHLAIALLLCASCAELTPRTYLTEMEQDDTRFFNPNQDFPVMAGDTGKTGLSRRELRDRVPASVHDVELSQVKRSLNNELATLESSQSESALDFYDQHKHKLRNTSEKIYFLKLPHAERRDYLEGRGFLQSSMSAPPHERALARRESEILLGMSKDDVVDSFGKPQRVDVAGNPSYENERWAYQMNGSTKYIYFESGQVQGWE